MQVRLGFLSCMTAGEDILSCKLEAALVWCTKTVGIVGLCVCYLTVSPYIQCTGIHGSWTSTYLGPPDDFRSTTYNIKNGVSANGRPKYAK